MEKLKLIQIDLTSRCNLRCEHCRSSELYSEIPLRDAKNIIQEAVDLGTERVGFTGGEPFLYPYLFDILEMCRDFGVECSITSNGTLINKDTAAHLDKIGIKNVGISLDYPVAELHDSKRGVKGTFAKATSAIRNLSKTSIEDVGVSTFLRKSNVKYFSDLVKLSIKLGANVMFVGRLVPAGRGKEIYQKEGLSPKEYKQILNYILSLETNSEIEICPEEPLYNVLKKELHKKLEKRYGSIDKLPTYIGCAAGDYKYYITPSQDVYPCPYLPLKLGNLKENTLSEIIASNNFALNAIRARKLNGKCGSCYYKSICGGCRAAAYGLTGDYLADDPLCFINIP